MEVVRLIKNGFEVFLEETEGFPGIDVGKWCAAEGDGGLNGVGDGVNARAGCDKRGWVRVSSGSRMAEAARPGVAAGIFWWVSASEMSA